MVSRESQGLQIALILFVMVTVVLAVTTYFFFQEAEEKTAQAAAARTEAAQFAEAAKQIEYENQLLKHMVGVEPKSQTELASIQQRLGGNKDMEIVLNRFHRDMELYAAGLSGQSLDYPTLQAHLIDQVNRRNAQLADSDDEVNELFAARDSVRQAEARRTAKAEAELLELQQDRDAERQEHAAHRARIDELAERTATILPEKLDEIQRLSDEMRKAIEDREARLRDLRELYLVMKKKHEAAQVDRTPEHPDGQIVHVNQRANLVWIDLGSADGLQRQMYFSVYDDQNQIGAVNPQAKAKIQITTIKEPHLAEARILKHDLRNPIMKGDKIHSPIFRKGQKTRFALAGFLDIDGDGKSDQAKVKSIITMNGGVVDAELLEDGSIAGEITAETQCLIKGEAPTDRTDERLIKGWNSMLEEADRKGLDIVPIDRLLGRMGYHDDSRVIDLQRGGPSGSGTTEQPRTRGPSYVS